MIDRVDVLLSEEEILGRVQEIADEINTEYAGLEVTLVCVLKGAVFFTAELAKRITVPVFMEFIKVASYTGTRSGSLTFDLGIKFPVAGKNIIIVEDVIDTGKTLFLLKQMLEKEKPLSLKFCTLLDKHDCRVVAFEGDYVGFTIGNEFVVGYGLDYDQRFRNLPYVGILRRE